MWVLTIPGITYLPVASMTASAEGHLSAAASPILAMAPPSINRSTGPYAGTPVPGITIAPRITRRVTPRACCADGPEGADCATGVCAAPDWKARMTTAADNAATACRDMPGL